MRHFAILASLIVFSTTVMAAGVPCPSNKYVITSSLSFKTTYDGHDFTEFLVSSEPAALIQASCTGFTGKTLELRVPLNSDGRRFDLNLSKRISHKFDSNTECAEARQHLLESTAEKSVTIDVTGDSFELN